MTPAQRLARLPGCWREGVLGVFAPGVGQVGWIRILRVGPDGAVYSWVDDGGWSSTADDDGADLSEYVPDLTDPATVGCLAEWAREMYGLPDLYCRPLLPGAWLVSRPSPLPFVAVIENTEGDAWAAAILDKLEPK